MVKIFMFILQIKIVLPASETYFQEKGGGEVFPHGPAEYLRRKQPKKAIFTGAWPILGLLEDLSQYYENLQQLEAEKCNVKNRGEERNRLRNKHI